MSNITNIKNAFYKSIHLKEVPDLTKLGLDESKHRDSYFLCQNVPFFNSLPMTYGGAGTSDEIRKFFNKEDFFNDLYVKDYIVNRDKDGNMKGLITSTPHTAYIGVHLDNTLYSAAEIMFRFSSKGRDHYETLNLMSERKYQLMYYRSDVEKTSVTEEEMQQMYDPAFSGFVIQSNDLKYNCFNRKFIVDRGVPSQNTPWIFLRIDNNGVEERIEDLVMEVLYMSQVTDNQGTVVKEALENFLSTDSSISLVSHSWPYTGMKALNHLNKKMPYFSSYMPTNNYTVTQLLKFGDCIQDSTKNFEIELDINLENGNRFYILSTNKNDKYDITDEIEADMHEDKLVPSGTNKVVVTLSPDTSNLVFCLRPGTEQEFESVNESFCLLKSIVDITNIS